MGRFRSCKVQKKHTRWRSFALTAGMPFHNYQGNSCNAASFIDCSLHGRVVSSAAYTFLPVVACALALAHRLALGAAIDD